MAAGRKLVPDQDFTDTQLKRFEETSQEFKLATAGLSNVQIGTMLDAYNWLGNTVSVVSPDVVFDFEKASEYSWERIEYNFTQKAWLRGHGATNDNLIPKVKEKEKKIVEDWLAKYGPALEKHMPAFGILDPETGNVQEPVLNAWVKNLWWERDPKHPERKQSPEWESVSDVMATQAQTWLEKPGTPEKRVADVLAIEAAKAEQEEALRQKKEDYQKNRLKIIEEMKANAKVYNTWFAVWHAIHEFAKKPQGDASIPEDIKVAVNQWRNSRFTLRNLAMPRRNAWSVKEEVIAAPFSAGSLTRPQVRALLYVFYLTEKEKAVEPGLTLPPYMDRSRLNPGYVQKLESKLEELNAEFDALPMEDDLKLPSWAM